MIEKFKDKLIITKTDVKKELGCKDSYAYTVLNRLNKKNKIKKIKKGKYTTKDNTYLIASNLHTPCYISFWSLIAYLGHTEQILNTIQVATTKRYSNVKFENYKIDFIKLSKKYFFGFYKQKIGDDYIFLADNEKLLIDCLIFEEKIGNYEEILNFLKEAIFTKEKVIKYLQKINNHSLNCKIGFLLEHFKGMDIFKDFKLNKNYYFLFKDMKGKFINSKWRIKHDIKR